MVLSCAYQQLRLATKESAISYFHGLLSLPLGITTSARNFFPPAERLFSSSGRPSPGAPGTWASWCVRGGVGDQILLERRGER